MAGTNPSSSEDDFIAQINVTPFVDVVLVLLTIFMITAPAIYQNTIKVELPQAKTGEATAGDRPLTFTVTRDGSVHWNGRVLDWKTLEDELKKIAASLTGKTATIEADQATPHGTVVRLMDTLRGQGLTRFSLDVAPAP